MAGKGRVLMAMSGGVDSSVAAVRLLQEGYELLGVTMRLHGSGSGCGSAAESDIADARQVAQTLGFDHYVLDLTEEFSRLVIDQFCDAYFNGLTPNPCIECNRHLKFDRLQQERKSLDFDFVATGHYARRVRNADGTYSLLKGTDLKKDQSYVLYRMDQDTLAHMLLPLGDMSKDQTRAIAAEYGLANANKGESQDICFIPDGDYASYVEARTEKASEPGPVVNEQGVVLGCHRGLVRYTTGQRKGLNLGGGTDPLYVLRKDVANNTLVVGGPEGLESSSVMARDLTFTCGSSWEGWKDVQAKIGYRMRPAQARAFAEGDVMKVEFAEPVRAVSPGQSLVVYDGEEVMGGGTLL